MRVPITKEALDIAKMKDFVFKNLKAGDVIQAPKDIYNHTLRSHEKANRIVTGFYPHIIVTMDDFGRVESYKYFEIYYLLKYGVFPDEEQ